MRFGMALIALLGALFVGSLVVPQKASAKRQGCTYGYKVSSVVNRDVAIGGVPYNPATTYSPTAVATVTSTGGGGFTLTQVKYPAFCSGGGAKTVTDTGVGDFNAIWIDWD